MPRNRRGPSLLRTVGRTAVISSTATAASRATHNRLDQQQQRQATAQQSQAEIEQMKAQLAAVQAAQSQPTAAPSPTVAPPPDLLSQLTQLAQLKDAGALSEEEFQLAKAKLLS